MTVPGRPDVFRGSDAVAAGLVTRAVLRGPRFRWLLPDTYARADAEPDLTLRSHAAFRWSRGRGIVSGYSAAELVGASCAPLGASTDITVTQDVLRSRDGVVVRHAALHPGEVTTVHGLRVTTPLRTAFDLGRRLGLVESVVAVDALARVHRFSPDLLLHFAVRYPHTRGVDRLMDTLGLADRRSGSPPETRLRLVLVHAGLPRPVVQHPVLDDDSRRAVWLDLAYPEPQARRRVRRPRPPRPRPGPRRHRTPHPARRRRMARPALHRPRHPAGPGPHRPRGHRRPRMIDPVDMALMAVSTASNSHHCHLDRCVTPRATRQAASSPVVAEPVITSLRRR